MNSTSQQQQQQHQLQQHQQYQEFFQNYQKSLQNHQILMGRFGNNGPIINTHHHLIPQPITNNNNNDHNHHHNRQQQQQHQVAHIEQLKKHFNLQYSNYIQTLQKQQQQQQGVIANDCNTNKKHATLKRASSCNSIAQNEDQEVASLVEEISDESGDEVEAIDELNDVYENELINDDDVDENEEEEEEEVGEREEETCTTFSEEHKSDAKIEKFNFTLKALEFSLYGYFKQINNNNNNNISESTSLAVSCLKLSNSQSKLKENNIYLNNNKAEKRNCIESGSTSSDVEPQAKKTKVFSIANLIESPSLNLINKNKNINNENDYKIDIPNELELRQTQVDELCLHGGLFSKRAISKGTKYGPYPGRALSPQEVKNKTENESLLMWEIFVDGRLSHFIDGSHRVNNSDLQWMTLVNSARFAHEQNLIAVQHQGEIFYEVCKDINQGQELLVWYGDSYLQFLGIPVALREMTDEPFNIEDTHSNGEGNDNNNTNINNNNKDGYQCDRCGKVFAYKYYRDKHLKYTRCVDQGDRKYPCNLCTRSFEKRDRLRIHILHVHEKHRPHKCTVCSKSFSQSSSLNKHMRVHSGERPYKCTYCNKAFTASSILRTHIRQHSGEKPFKCKFCGKAFASHAAHDSHVRRTHFIKKEDM